MQANLILQEGLYVHYDYPFHLLLFQNLFSMQITKLNFSDTGAFALLFLEYLNKNKSLKEFYSLFPTLENFPKQIKNKKYDTTLRSTLCDVLESQYVSIKKSPSVEKNLQLLKKENTYTITTGHQLNICTGPLYFIYKIITVLNATRLLNEKYSEYNFVPVYWMASEDHDFEEISYVNIFGKRYTWETHQTGAVGRMDPKSLENLMMEIPGEFEIFKRAYKSNNTLSGAVRYYVNELFSEDGLIVLDADDHRLKKSFNHVIKDELSNQVSARYVNEQSQKLESLGFKALISPRDINLFFLDNTLRERIVFKDEKFNVLNTKLSFTEDEIITLTEKEPEKFSPNVIMRPLYQEYILPNLAYVGGPAEVAYWLQLKTLFDHFGIQFPILLPRNFVLFVNHVAHRKIVKTGASIMDVFVPETSLQNRLVGRIGDNELDLNKEKGLISEFFKNLEDKAGSIDPTLGKVVEAESKKSLNGLDKIEQKLLKAKKRQHEDLIRQISAWKEMLFPGGTQQERTQNFLNFYLNDNEFLDKLKDGLSPFDLKYHILVDDNSNH